MIYTNWKFFDGEDTTEPQPELNTDKVKYEDFDTKSPLLSGGCYTEPEPEGAQVPEYEPRPEMAGSPNPDGTPNPADFNKATSGEEQVAYKKINVGGVDYAFKDEGEVEQLAAKGIEYAQAQTRLAPYIAAIDDIERDPQLGNLIVEVIRRYKNNIPLVQPQAETQQEDPNKEPEQGDDEDYDDYEKRLEAWKQAQQKAMVEKTINERMAAIQQQNQMATIQQANQKIINYVNADPDRAVILQEIGSPSFDPNMRQRMEWDGPYFMRVYDTIRASKGLRPYFGAPTLFGVQPVQPQSTTKTPFTEKGGAANRSPRGGVSVDKLPDFKTMSDEQFRQFKQSVMLSSMS